MDEEVCEMDGNQPKWNNRIPIQEQSGYSIRNHIIQHLHIHWEREKSPTPCTYLHQAHQRADTRGRETARRIETDKSIIILHLQHWAHRVFSTKIRYIKHREQHSIQNFKSQAIHQQTERTKITNPSSNLSLQTKRDIKTLIIA